MKKVKVLKTVCRVCKKVLMHPTLGRLAPAVFDSALPVHPDKCNDKPGSSITWAWCEKCHHDATVRLEQKRQEYLAHLKRQAQSRGTKTWEHPFGMVTHWKGIFTLRIFKMQEYGKLEKLAQHCAEDLDQIFSCAARHELNSVRVMLKDSKPRKGIPNAKKNRR